MRANITVVGLGKRMTGTSKKNNKPYDFQAVSFLFDDQFTTGQKAATANFSGSDVDAVGGMNIGQEYDVVMHFYNNQPIIDALLA